VNGLERLNVEILSISQGLQDCLFRFYHILNSTSYVSNTVSGAGVYCGHNNFAGNGLIAKIKERNLFGF
jgi:hypothetical protein